MVDRLKFFFYMFMMDFTVFSSLQKTPIKFSLLNNKSNFFFIFSGYILFDHYYC